MFDHFLIGELESMRLPERAVDDGYEQEEAGAGREETSVSATPASTSAAEDTPTDQEARETGEAMSLLLDDWLRGLHRTLQQSADRRRASPGQMEIPTRS